MFDLLRTVVCFIAIATFKLSVSDSLSAVDYLSVSTDREIVYLYVDLNTVRL